MIAYLSVDQIVALHRALVDHFGGADSLRDGGSLESAAARPGMTFGGEDLYSDLASKAAALMHSLVLSHPFLDGNKRVGVASAELFVELNGYVLESPDDEMEAMTLAVAEGKIEAEALAIWIRQRLRPAD